MSKLEELIQQYCPDGVEYKKLEDCIKSLNTGLNPRQFFRLNTDDATNFYITIREIQNNTIVINDKTDRINDEALKLCNNRSNLEKGDVLFSGTGTIGEVAALEETPTNWNIKEGVYSIKPDPNIIFYRFLMYLLQSKSIKQAYLKKAAGGTVKSVPMVEMRKLEIPVPPLPIQEEIVRILDTFTELQAELQAELQKRLQQYNYYRDKLLLNFTPEQDAKEYYLEEITTDIYSGATPSKEKREFWENGTIPWMSSGEVNLGKVYDVEGRITQLGYDKCSTKMVPRGSVVIALAGQGKTRGTVALLKTTVCTNQSLAALVPNTKMVSGEYLYHYLRTQYMKLREVSAGDGTRGGLNLKMLRSYKVIIPPMEEQQRIVDILDRFDALTTDITAGLPAEIEARRKQYEYYRDILLTFNRKTVCANKLL